MMYDECACLGEIPSIDLLNEDAYLEANPDVRVRDISAREHFITCGKHEGRRQAVNQGRVAAIREMKLSQLRFKQKPSPERQPGAPLNFLTRNLVEEFCIPAHPPVSEHNYTDFFIDLVRKNPDKLFVDIGAGLKPVVTSNMVNVEIYPNVSTDVVCVGEDLPFENNQFDFALCAAVLEHTRRPWEVAREICRIVKPGGTIRIDWPFISTVHGYPNHYFNATPEGVKSLFERDCEIVSSKVEPNNHPIHALWWILKMWQYGLSGEDLSVFERMSIGDMLAKAPDKLQAEPFCQNLSRDVAVIIPAGSTLVARKK